MKFDMEKSMDLKHRTFPEAMERAKIISGKTNEEIARELSVRLGRETPFPASTVQGWFNLDRDYWPSTAILPHLCAVLGNSIPIDWLVEQTRSIPAYGMEATPSNILSGLPGMVCQFGRIGERIGSAVEDGEVTPREAREVLGEVATFKTLLERLESLLSPLAEKAKRK